MGGFSFAIEKTAEEPKIRIDVIPTFSLIFASGFGIRDVAGRPLRCSYRKYDFEKTDTQLLREIRP